MPTPARPPLPPPSATVQRSSSSRLPVTTTTAASIKGSIAAQGRSRSYSHTSGAPPLAGSVLSLKFLPYRWPVDSPSLACSLASRPNRSSARPSAEAGSSRSSFRVSRSAHGGRPSFSRTAPSTTTCPSTSSSAASASTSAVVSPLYFPSFDTPVPPSLLRAGYLDPAPSPLLRPSAASPGAAVAVAPNASGSSYRRRRSSTLSPPILQTPSSAGLSTLTASTSYFDAHHAPDALARPVGPLTLHLPTPPAHPPSSKSTGRGGLSLSLSPPGANGFKHHLLPSPVFVEGSDGGFSLALALAQEEAEGTVET